MDLSSVGRRWGLSFLLSGFLGSSFRRSLCRLPMKDSSPSFLVSGYFFFRFEVSLRTSSSLAAFFAFARASPVFASESTSS